MKQISVCVFALLLISVNVTEVWAQSATESSVRAVFLDSFKLVLVEHGIRIGFQAKTRRERDGPFWKDYRRSVRMPDDWEDTEGHEGADRLRLRGRWAIIPGLRDSPHARRPR